MSGWNKVAIEFMVDDIINDTDIASRANGLERELCRNMLLGFPNGPLFSDMVRWGLDVYASDESRKAFYEHFALSDERYCEWLQRPERAEHIALVNARGKVHIEDDWEWRLSEWERQRDKWVELENGEYIKVPYNGPRIDEHKHIIRLAKRPAPEVIFPATGIYIYYHPYEGYKIGKAENVPRRMDKHWTSAPAARLLHVIETNNLSWCEGFLHGRLAPWRRHRNHEYFDLNPYHLAWLFSIDVLNEPTSFGEQMSLLDLL